MYICAHHELVRVSLKERCPGLYLLMAKVCFSDVLNIIPCYQRLICLPQFDSCLFGANGQMQSQTRLQTGAEIDAISSVHTQTKPILIFGFVDTF